MKNDLIHLQLQCSESWSDMKPTEAGAYCGVCSTELVDFSGWPSAEINTYLKHNSGKRICGKFTKNQLHSESPALYQPLVQFSLRSLVLGAALSSFLSFDLMANQEVVLGNLPGGHGLRVSAESIVVTEKDGVTPIAMAKLTLFSPEGIELRTFYTSLTGEAEFTQFLNEGVYSVLVERDGFISKRIYISRMNWYENNRVKLSKKIK